MRVLLTVLLCLTVHVAAAEKMNILVLLADDWRHDTLSCAGNPVVRTPNIDALAREGCRFTHACVTTSICGVSRASLFTGQWMSRHGCTGFTEFKTPWAETYPGIFRADGYWTGHIGKWHNGTFPAAQFDFGRSYSNKFMLKQPDGSTIHITQKNENDALEFLRSRPREKPFCLTLAFFATHAEDQYIPQPASEALYVNDTVPVPKTATDEHFKRLPPFVGNEKNEGRRRWRLRFDTPEKYQEYMKNYYRLATEVDTVVGRVIAELKAQGALENTLIVFSGDNGYFHGEHGLADKWYPYEESIRVPLIVRDPRLPAEKRGLTNSELVLNVDIAPTLLAAAGMNVPARMQGRNVAPLYLEPSTQKWRTEFFYEHAIIKNKDFIPASQALVRKDAKYILWPDFDSEEFFDLKNDPYEENNLIKSPAHAETVREMKKRFQELREAAQ
ncbi:MAG TPA: sulfatase [Planctomycetota bacterium]|nr:sulfatase [Planctomycetota bacterium]